VKPSISCCFFTINHFLFSDYIITNLIGGKMNKYTVVSLLVVSLCCSSPASATGSNATSAKLLKKKEFIQRIIDAKRNGNAQISRDAIELRDFISEQVGGLNNLIVPADDADIPQPLLDDGSVDPFFANSPARRFLGQQLFYDPIRTNNIQPEFGGVPETSQTASCGSCHVPEAAGKTGEILNFSVGGEGKFFTDAEGNFNFRSYTNRSFRRRYNCSIRHVRRR